MRSHNHITITGNLGKAPEVRYAQDGKAICKFSVAVSDRKKNKAGQYEDVTTWLRVTCFGKTGENAGQYLDKGSQVLVAGRLEVEEYTDKDGNKRTSVGILADDVQFLGGKGGDKKAGEPKKAPEPAGGGAGEVDDLPFRQHEAGFSW